MLSFLSVIYFLIVIGFLAASYYPLLKQKFLSHAVVEKKKKISLIPSYPPVHRSSAKLFSLVLVPQSLPPIYLVNVLMLMSDSGKRVTLDYNVYHCDTGKTDRFTVISRRIRAQLRRTGELIRFSPNIDNRCILPVGTEIRARLVPGDVAYTFGVAELGICITVYPGGEAQELSLFFNKVGVYEKAQTSFIVSHSALPVPTVIQVVTIEEFEA